LVTVVGNSTFKNFISSCQSTSASVSIRLLGDLGRCSDCNPMRGILANDRRACCVKFLSRVEMEDLNVPRLPVEWLIVEDNQLVRLLALRNYLSAGLFIIKHGDDATRDLDEKQTFRSSTRQAVVELTQQNILPHVVDVLLRVLVSLTILRDNVPNTGQCCKVFDVMKHDFGLAVVALVVGLCRVRASVEFEVEFTIPSHKFKTFFDPFLKASKEVIDRITHLDTRQETDLVAHATASSKLLDMLPGRATTTISLSKCKKRGWILIHGFVLGDTASHITKVGFGSCDPVECSVWEVVDVIPAKFLCEESRHTCKSADLRQLGRVTKGVGKPEGSAS
ncbi:putative alpha-mannosidase I, partial [Aureobasidium melanogenum]